MWPIQHDSQLVLSGIIATLYLVVLILGGRRLQRFSSLLLVGGCLYLLQPTLWNLPWMQYASRTVTGLALFPLLAMTFFMTIWSERRVASGAHVRRGSSAYWLVSAAIFAVQLVPFTIHTYGFGQWLASFETAVTTSSGTRTNDQTVVKFKDSSLYVWPWTNPFLSVLLRTGDGQAMILSPGVTSAKEGTIPAPLPVRYYKHGSLFTQ
jgi:hypothetical protein